MGVFLAVTVTGTVFLLAILSKVPFATVVSRSTIIFLLFGTLGAVLGSLLEVFLVPEVIEKNIIELNKKMKLNENDDIVADLGDLLETKDNLKGTPNQLLQASNDFNSKAKEEDFGDLLD
jgi:uncharacterized membrane protein